MSTRGVKLSDLSPAARAQVEAALGEQRGGTGKRTKKAIPKADTNVVCHTCRVALTSEPAMKRHSDATGHTRYEIPLDSPTPGR